MSDNYLMKPCPFCGSAGAIEEVEGAIGKAWSPYCSAALKEDDCILGHTLLSFTRKKEAVEAWNTRAKIIEDVSYVRIEPSLI